ncbi:hypothetical protein GALL_453640 [mine drainage metagenome]|uniref:Uncharacterized protein n=1 Tax=mine drainage metagenome TaxID=410659 RepID=A0A1J5Q6B7_9ZZZZ
MIVTAVLLAASSARIVFLNSEIKTLEASCVEFQARIATWGDKSPKDLQEAETEYAWLTNERDSKKESRTIWYGAALLSLIALVISLSLLIGNSK